MKKIVIFGTGDIAQIAKYYFEIDSPYQVVAFTVDKDYIQEVQFEGLPIYPFEEIERHFPPNEYEMFIALSYANMNKLRALKFQQAKEKGYRLVSYVSSKCTYLSQFNCGENCFIFEDNTIQPFVKIGDNVTIWSGNHIGHHSRIAAHNFISSHVVISGHCVLESYCFLGVNSTIGHNVTIAEGTLVGAAAVITKDTEPYSVWVPPRSVLLDKKSTDLKL
ncbi:sugar O-acyltransferase (sialic acid O-acetyltransferase NeuD family) [Thermonema lapsum]|uniref:Sugar O-acyltransferase (Sialic acid O-acetyltransferase NeuD family) n=1 Tax=Thermonema lapsum TaxID=28195 RepID=A0A846MMA8_9BACT|nr:acetyltransferase [Thermonema lapsum]NIK72517.1 sugar O-acyltransferase (sialic acid O-acetyltransferase NeuD family) [Thermonema lapsum]